MRKVICLILVLVMGIAVLSGCGAQNNASAASTSTGSVQTTTTETPAEVKQVTVKMEGVTSPTFTAQYWDNYVKIVEKDNPDIDLQMDLAPGTDRIPWIKAKYSAGNAPDIITADTSTFSNVDGAYSEVPTDLLSNVLDSAIVKTGGKVIEMPVDLQLKSQVFYNKKMFTDAGITNVPTNWSEFTEDCAKLQEKNVAPLMGCKEAWFDAFGYATAVLQPDVIDSDADFLSKLNAGTAKWNNPAMADSLKRFQDLTTKSYWAKGSNSFAYAQSVDEFFKGSAAMIINGSWMAPQIDGLSPKPDFDIGIFPLPQTTGVKSIGATTDYWAVFDASTVKDAAWKTVKYCIVDNQDQYTSYLKNDNLLSVTKTPVTYEATPMVALFNQNAANLQPVMDFAGVSGDIGFPAGFSDFYNNSLQAVYSGQDITTVLDSMDKQYQSLLKK
jgi:raffinose/stachyose/melibiose transport system substrate-binding protein